MQDYFDDQSLDAFSDDQYQGDPQGQAPAQQSVQPPVPPQPQIDPNEYNQLKETVTRLDPLVKLLQGQGQATSKQDEVRTFVESIIDDVAKQRGYISDANLEVREVVRELGVASEVAASNYYGYMIESVMNDPASTLQERETAQAIVQLYQQPATKAQAIKLAAQVYGKPPSRQSQGVGQTQTFGHQPGVRQSQTQKPFTNESEFNQAYYDDKHPKHKLAQEWNARILRSGEQLQDTPY